LADAVTDVAFEAADKNNSGELCFEEFSAWLESGRQLTLSTSQPHSSSFDL
jgi:hypothetical protein